MLKRSGSLPFDEESDLKRFAKIRDLRFRETLSGRESAITRHFQAEKTPPKLPPPRQHICDGRNTGQKGIDPMMQACRL